MMVNYRRKDSINLKFSHVFVVWRIKVSGHDSYLCSLHRETSLSLHRCPLRYHQINLRIFL